MDYFTTLKQRLLPITITAILLTVFLIQINSMVAIEFQESGLSEPANLTLHGSTPAMSWNPTSQQLVINSAFDYCCGYEEQQNTFKEDLGVYTLDLKGKARQVHSEQGYHPFWHNNQTLGWGNSPYEEGKEGLFLLDISQKKNIPKQVGISRGVYHTLPAINGKILFYSGFPERQGWTFADPETGAITSSDFKGDSWQIPKKLISDQCPQTVGNRKIRINDDFYYELTVGKKSTIVTKTPFMVGTHTCPGIETENPNENEWDEGETEGDCYPVRACLSPDGNHLAFLEQGASRWEYIVKIIAVSQK